jgi:cytosine/uracil/thiamine/allantoin permease
MLLVFVSFIFDSDRMGAVALMSLLVSGVLGFIVFDIAVIAKTTTAPRLDLTSLFSSQTSPFFLWGSILGAIIGALAGFCMKVPSRSKKISNPEKNPDT